jgi:Tfp pilus assembly protein PilN
MKLSPLRLSTIRLAVLLLQDRLAVAAVTGDRVDSFTIATENPGEVLREELANRQLAPRTVALALSRGSAFVRPMELPTVAGDTREMVRLNLEGHLPFAAEDTAFDFAPLPSDGDGGAREETLQRVLLVAAEPRVVEAALRIAAEARLRPASLTVAAHDLLALACPERGQRVVWLHHTGTTADILCLAGPSLMLSRAVAAADEASVVEEVRRSLAAVRWKECDAVWLSGDLPPEAVATASLPAPVSQPPYPARVRERLSKLPSEERGAHELALAVALARRGRPLDLLPDRLRPRRISRAQGLTLGLAAVTALLLVTAFLVPSLRERRHLARINNEIARLDPQVRAIERTVRDLERKQKLLTTITGLEAGAIRPLPVLRDLTDTLPSDTWLTTLSLDGKGVELTGQAAAASALIPLLENSPRLERVEFSSPVTRGRDKEQFRIRAAWETGGAQATGTPGASPDATAAPAVVEPPARSPRQPQVSPGVGQPTPQLSPPGAPTPPRAGGARQ